MTKRLAVPAHDMASPTCWCHPLIVTPLGACMIVDGAAVAVAGIGGCYPPLLNHQDGIGAALKCIPGYWLWKSEDQ